MFRKVVVVLMLSLLAGCMAKLSYNFADWIIEWTVADYVRLDKAQKKQLRIDIDKHLAWHKQTQINRYRDWLLEFKAQLPSGLNRQWLLAWTGQLPFFWQDVALEITPDVVTLLQSLSGQQVQQMIASLDESQLELEQEYLDPDLQKRLEERLERTEDFISDLLGKLNPQQKALIAQWNNQAGDSTALWLQNRAQWTRRFEQALNNRASEQFADEITLLFVYQQQLWTDEYRQSVEENLQRGINLALAIEPTVSARQRNKLNQFLDKWIGVLAKLLL